MSGENDSQEKAKQQQGRRNKPRPNTEGGPQENQGQTGRSVVSLDTVFPARDCSLWTFVRLALWLVYGTLAVARLTGLIQTINGNSGCARPLYCFCLRSWGLNPVCLTLCSRSSAVCLSLHSDRHVTLLAFLAQVRQLLPLVVRLRPV